MSHASIANPASATVPTNSRGILQFLKAWFRRQAELSAMRRELDCMTDRQLDDIGVTRHDIPELMRRAYQNR